MSETLRKEELQVKHFLRADPFGEVISICKYKNNLMEIKDLVEDTEDFFLHIYEKATGNITVNGSEIKKTLDEWIDEGNILRDPLNCKLIFIEGYAGCGKSTLVQHILYQLLNNENYEYSYYNYDLGTTLLKDVWNFEGVIMTDWWMRDGASLDFENVTNQAYRVRAQVDVFMPGSARVGKLKGKSDGSIITSLNSKDGITRGELQRSAMNVLRTCLKLL